MSILTSREKRPPDRPTESGPGLPRRGASTFWSKTDTLDTEAVARPVLSGQAVAVPKSANGTIEMWQGIKLLIYGLFQKGRVLAQDGELSR